MLSLSGVFASSMPFWACFGKKTDNKMTAGLGGEGGGKIRPRKSRTDYLKRKIFANGETQGLLAEEALSHS